MKKTKGVEGKRLAKKKKNENEICLSRAAKKYNIGYNNGYTQSEKSPKQTTEDKKTTDNKKSLHKQDIAKKIKLEKRERQCKSRKNIQKICVSKKDRKLLK